MKITTNELRAFNKAMNDNKDAFYILKLKLIAAQARKAELKELFNKVYTDVLAENEFFTEHGERVTTDAESYELNQSDFDRYLQLAVSKMHNLGYTDAEGNYNEGYNEMQLVHDAENALVDFQISILPEALQAALQDVKTSYKYRQKLLKIFLS